MLPSNADKSFEKFLQMKGKIGDNLSETDTRDKIIDPIFKECLGWSENNIKREINVHPGYLDYIFSINEVPVFVLEAKKVGKYFELPIDKKQRQYIIEGTIWSNKSVREAFQQVQKYAADSGIKYAVISNGKQFIIFDAFRRGGWKRGYCLVFSSWEDIKNNFTLFWNILSIDGVSNGSFNQYVTKNRPIFKFEKPLGYFSYQEQTVSHNSLASSLYPIIENIFGELIDDSQDDILKSCYVYQRHHRNASEYLKPRFNELPKYAELYGFESFYETKGGAGKFLVSFEKCERFLRREKKEGSVIMLLGGIGCGKTTFIHHFFKVSLKDRKNILWFYVDFRNSSPDVNTIEDYIYDSIVEGYENKYEDRFKKELSDVGLNKINKDPNIILQMFSFLTFKGYSISLVLDNVDQHSKLSSEYQEKAILISQNLTKRLKTITILTLREESFFKSTRSGVLDAYDMVLSKMHITSPNFEQVVRKRIDYMEQLLKLDDHDIFLKTNIRLSISGQKQILQMLFQILSRSLNSRRDMGNEILDFIDDMSGGDMREALKLFNLFLISGNTDIPEMMNIELRDNPRGSYWDGYFIPFHHIINSIILDDSRYYSMQNSNILNVFNLNPEYTNSHFLNLRILDYLNSRKNFHSSIGNGYVNISSILIDAQTSNVSKNAIEGAIKILVNYNLIEFDNQSKTGFEYASYLRITKTGIYYFNKLINTFVYLDLMWGDTPICHPPTLNLLKKRIQSDKIKDDLNRTKFRFNRTDIYIKYLSDMENNEWLDYPELLYSALSKRKFMDKIAEEYESEKKYIIDRMTRVRKRYNK